MMQSLFFTALVVLICAGWVAWGQQAGTLTQERHPQLTMQTCTKSGGCQTQQGSVVIDSNWRWTHAVGQPKNCYTGNQWDTSLCPDGPTCAKNCAIDGADYPGTYGVTTSGSTLNLKFVTQGPYSKNIGSRLYFLESDTQYKIFKLKNREFTFDVDEIGRAHV